MTNYRSSVLQRLLGGAAAAIAIVLGHLMFWDNAVLAVARCFVFGIIGVVLGIVAAMIDLRTADAYSDVTSESSIFDLIFLGSHDREPAAPIYLSMGVSLVVVSTLIWFPIRLAHDEAIFPTIDEFLNITLGTNPSNEPGKPLF